MNEKLLTVVIPAYNAEAYLSECIESILNQTVSDYKIIIVDDGSTDQTLYIAQSYAKKHPDIIQCISQKNQGQGAARNTGMELVDTEYIAFLDSDDWWECHLIEKLKEELTHHEDCPDLIFTLPWIYDMVTKRCLMWYDRDIMEKIFPDDQSGISKEVNIIHDRRLYELEVNACRRIYKTSFIKQNNFMFPIGVKWEDVQPHFYLLHNAQICIALKETGFIYRINSGGQTTSGRGISRLDTITVFRDTIHMAIDDHWPREEIAYILRTMFIFVQWCIRVTNTEYIVPLLKGFHELFCDVPNTYFKMYFKLCSPHRKKEILLKKILRSPFYLILQDYQIRAIGKKHMECIKNILNKFRRK